MMAKNSDSKSSSNDDSSGKISRSEYKEDSSNSIKGPRAGAVQKFEAILENGDKQELWEFLRGTTDSERKIFASVSVKWQKDALRVHAVEMPPGHFYNKYKFEEHVVHTIILACLATASEEQLSKLNWDLLRFEDADLEALASLKPEALTNFGEILCKNGSHHFFRIQQLMRHKICHKPQSDSYILAMIQGATPDWKEERTLYDWIVANPEIVEDEFWRIFEIDGTSADGLAVIDGRHWSKNLWTDALLSLAKDGKLPRKRLISASLSALNRGFNRRNSAWYANFHRLLEPTAEEKNELVEEYARLLGSANAATVTFALKYLKEIDRDNPLKTELLARNIPLAMVSTVKSVVLESLGLLEKAIKRDGSFASQACLVALTGLQHDSAETHNKIITLLEKYGDSNREELLAKLHRNIDFIAPSVRSRVESWVGPSAPESVLFTRSVQSIPRNPAFKRYEMERSSSPGWPLSCSIPIDAIQTVDQIIEIGSYCIDNPADLHQFEQVIDAVSRIPVTERESFKSKSAPLKQRIRKLVGSASQPFIPETLQGTLSEFLRTWICIVTGADERGMLGARGSGILVFTSQKMLRILDRVKQEIFLPTLSCPTHFGGWIDPIIFSSREKQWIDANVPADAHDLLVALLRIPTEHAERLENSDLVKDGKMRTTINYILGSYAPATEAAVPLATLANCLRHPLDKQVGLQFLKDNLRNKDWQIELVRLLTISVPSLQEALFDSGVKYSAMSVDGWSIDSYSLPPFFELLSAPGAPLGKKALNLLAIGLILPDAECCGFAKDATILAIQEQRLDLEQLAIFLAAYLHSDRRKPKRLSESLKEIARVSELHTDAVIQLIEFSLNGNPDDTGRDFLKLLELLLELVSDSGIKLTNDRAKNYLASIRKGPKTKLLVEQLLKRFEIPAVPSLN